MNERRLIGYRIRIDYGIFTLWVCRDACGEFDFSILRRNALIFESKELALNAIDPIRGCPFAIACLAKIVAVYHRKKIVEPIVVETNATIEEKTNGGIVCDVVDGPCTCGAWHKA